MPCCLLQRLEELPIAAIDLETTGISPGLGHRVIEIGIVRLEHGRPSREYEQLVDPGRTVSPAVTALTGISQRMLQGKPRFADQLPQFLSMLSGAVILGHNINFDLSFLQAELARLGTDLRQAIGESPILDTLRIARRRFGRGGNSLPVLSTRLGVQPAAAHRALADARTTLAILEQLLEPVGGFRMTLRDALNLQGGALDLMHEPAGQVLPLELAEAIEAGRPVMMEYLDARGCRTHRLVQPLHVQQVHRQLFLVAHCHLRNDRRTFRLDRIIGLRLADPPKDADVFKSPANNMSRPGLPPGYYA